MDGVGTYLGKRYVKYIRGESVTRIAFYSLLFESGQRNRGKVASVAEFFETH